MTTTLKNGMTVEDPRLDRIYEEDWRSLNYAVGDELVKLDQPIYRPRSYTWSIDKNLDQRAEGACVGFAFAHDLAARPVPVSGVTDEYARSLYFASQRIDPWPGGAYPGASPFYEGTSVLGGAKTCKDRGFFDSYWWGITVEESARAFAYFGPGVAGVNWHTGMFKPDANGFIHPIGSIAGGHAVLIHSIQIVYKKGTGWSWWTRTWADVDYEKSYIVIHNSWGPRWGNQGRAKLTLAAFGYLLAQNGEVCFPKRSDKLFITEGNEAA